MRSSIIIIFLVFFFSCVSLNNTKKIKLKYYEGVIGHKITMNIPEGYKLIKINTGGEGEEHRYWYFDSSLIYLSDASGIVTVNEQSIRKQEGAYYKKIMTDSIILKGVNTSGNYWAEVKYKGLLYGYSNVPPNKKQLYDSAIQSVKYKY